LVFLAYWPLAHSTLHRTLDITLHSTVNTQYSKYTVQTHQDYSVLSNWMQRADNSITNISSL